MEHTPIKHYYKHINHTSTNFKLNLIKPSYTGSDRYQTFMAYTISKKKILSKKWINVPLLQIVFSISWDIYQLVTIRK